VSHRAARSFFVIWNISVPLMFCPNGDISMQGNGNPNWQDKFLGGMILAGFVVVAIVAGLFSLATWSGDSRDHASTRPGQSNSATN
jgi:hypothetical protein